MRAIIELQPNKYRNLTLGAIRDMVQNRDELKEPVIRAFVALPGETLVEESVRILPGGRLFDGCKAVLLDLLASFTTMETKKCKECQMDIPFKAKKCPHCQADLRSWFNRHPYATVFLGFFVLISVIMASSDDAPTENLTSGTEATPTATQASTVSVGSEGFLRVESDEKILVAITAESQEAMMKSFAANDTAGVAELVLQGKIFTVNAGTKVLVIDQASLGVRKIRVLEGDQMYKTGFVPMEFIKSQ